MRQVEIRVGDVFLVNTGGKTRYFIAIAPIDGRENRFLFVSPTRLMTDKSCILSPGPSMPDFIIQDSAICYRRAKDLNGKQLAQIIVGDQAEPIFSFQPEEIDKIIQGGIRSTTLKNKYRALLDEWERSRWDF